MAIPIRTTTLQAAESNNNNEGGLLTFFVSGRNNTKLVSIVAAILFLFAFLSLQINSISIPRVIQEENERLQKQLELVQQNSISTLKQLDQVREQLGLANTKLGEIAVSAASPTTTTTITKSTIDECRDMFTTAHQGGAGEFTKEQIIDRCTRSSGVLYNACEDLQSFTGLSDDEFYNRLGRKGRFHFEGEHRFWNPQTTTELAWYYATSVDYLFANAIHDVPVDIIDIVAKKQYEPILDYSGGVGNIILHLAKKGIRCHYFGIGILEYKFAQYRVRKNGLQNLVQFKEPYSSKTNYQFDPLTDPLPRSRDGDGGESLGAIIAMDVLEHIPNYHIVVQAMVDSLRVGGIIIENSPFANARSDIDSKGGGDDVRVHLSNGGITMENAMGPKMIKKKHETKNIFYWEKIKE